MTFIPDKILHRPAEDWFAEFQELRKRYPNEPAHRLADVVDGKLFIDHLENEVVPPSEPAVEFMQRNHKRDFRDPRGHFASRYVDEGNQSGANGLHG